jgi:hypothetical protein
VRRYLMRDSYLRHARLLSPASGAALRDLIDAGLILDSVVVWLDDLAWIHR